MITALEGNGHSVRIIDQTRLPLEKVLLEIHSAEEMAGAIKGMKLRGAPLIGVAAAYGMVLAMQECTGSREYLEENYRRAEDLLAATRPTAVNLFWALGQMRRVFEKTREMEVESMRQSLKAEADRLYRHDLEVNQAIGSHGGQLFNQPSEIMTICNAGALATCGYGTALGVIRHLHQRGMIRRVWVCETRPVLQGARLTAWELNEEGIPFTLITDSMAAQVLSSQAVAAVITGADRVAANGDAANKIGTLGLSILAAHFGVPFYVAAPLSTIDPAMSDGSGIVIEERSGDEVRMMNGRSITVPAAPIYNPAFDVTPGGQISAIITEKGLARNPYSRSLQDLLQQQ